MDIFDELLCPPGVRYRNGRSKPAGQRGVRGSTRVRSLKSRTGEQATMQNFSELNTPALPTASLASWGYVYQIGTQSVAVGSNVTFSNNGPLTAINHTPGNAAIEVALAGTYNISFAVYTTQNNPQDWAVVINGVVRSRFNSAGQSISGDTSMVLDALDRVTIRNVNTIPDPVTLREGDFTTAYVLIYKVDS
ncbi:MAG: hypothetical protein PHC92_02435 [Syntrophomonadaceae bacterium]|nr:hypothetical protein [Syntrophomonadaceae bacterium]MDD3022448.1 hypothetical protein [Syntrophomonadaceae bacterium]